MNTNKAYDYLIEIGVSPGDIGGNRNDSAILMLINSHKYYRQWLTKQYAGFVAIETAINDPRQYTTWEAE